MNTQRNISPFLINLLFSLLFFVVIIIFFSPILTPGQIIYGDIDIGLKTDRYLEEMTGIWNKRWSTPTTFRMPRVWFTLPFYALSRLFSSNGPLLLKALILALIFFAGINCRILVGRLLRDSGYSSDSPIKRYFPVWFAGLVYAVNPWSVTRIQHLFLLIGYAFYPLLLAVLWDLFASPAPPANFKRAFGRVGRASVVFAMCATMQHYFLFGAMTTALASFVGLGRWLWIAHRNEKKLVFIALRWVQLNATFGILAFLLVSYWLIPYVYSLFSGTLPLPNNINVDYTIDIFSRNSSISHVALGTSYWWPMFSLESLPVSSWIGGGVVGFISFGVLLTRRWRWSLPIPVIILAVLSTGTYYSALRPLYYILVFDVPSPFGLVFRDPNKLVGLLVFFASINIGFSLAWISRRLSNLAILPLITILIACWIAWNMPWHHHFVSGYYKPADLPTSYKNLYNFLEEQTQEDPYSRVLYLPTTDYMFDPSYGYTVPSWNIYEREGYAPLYRATSDFAVFNSPMDTLYHNEGAASSVAEYYQYIQYLLEQGHDGLLSPHFQMAGVEWVVLQTVYDDQTVQQEAMLNTLLMSDLEHVYSDQGIHVFHVGQSLSQLQTVSRVFYTSKGYGVLAPLLLNFPDIFLDSGIVFTAQQAEAEYHNIRPGDIVDLSNWNDVVLSNLPDNYYSFPIEWSVNTTGWLPEKFNGAGMSLVLDRYNLPIYIDEFDLGGNIVFAEQQFNVEPNLQTLLPWHDMESLQGLFQSDDRITISSTPENSISIEKSLQNAGWEIVESDAIRIDNRTGLRFYTRLDAENVSNFHIKIQFYNDDGEQIGIQYYVPSESASSYTGAELAGWIPIPNTSVYAYVQVLTQAQDPTVPTRWQLSGATIEEAAAQNTTPVQTSTTVQVRSQTPYRVFVRALASPRAGLIQVDYGDHSTSLDTLNLTDNRFMWYELEPFMPDEEQIPITLTNVAGFNVVNSVVVIPNDQFEQISNDIQQQVAQVNIFSIVDAVSEMDYAGREDMFVHHTADTSSATVYFADGTLTTPVYIPRPGQYQLTVVHETLDVGQTGELVLLDDNQNSVASTELTGAVSQEIGMTHMVTDLDAGEYQFVLRFPEETTPTPIRFMLSSGENNILEDDPNQFVYRPASSETWAIVSTDDIPTHGNTYRLSYELSTHALENVHIKFLFFDDNQQELPIVKYIGSNCRWPDGSTLCTTYQDVIPVPENVNFMRIQILGQADAELSGQLNIRTFSLVSLDQYFAIDHLIIQNVPPTTNQNKSVEIADESNRAWPDLALSLDYAEEIEVILWRESPSNLWQISGEQTGQALPINGVHQGFWVSAGNPVHVSTSLDTIYELSVGISIITLVVLAAIWAIEYWSTRD